jgi:hypothetical protein
MQFQPAKFLEEYGPAEQGGASQATLQPASMYPWDFSSPDRDEVLALLGPGDQKRTIRLIAGALVAGFALGWAGGFGWYGSADVATPSPVTQTEAISHRPSEAKSGGKAEGARKIASASGVQTPPSVSTVTAAAGGASVKPQAERAPIVPAAETRPTTIEGWTVLDVRGGTAVLEGPDGVRMATRGDTVPGIGRIDSIVRWGNRWIVATANGLIATP